jgi:FkbM family methyltransferase
MFSKLCTVAGPLIARNRRSSPVRLAHRVATFIEDAYQNTDLDLATNGESRIVAALAHADIRTAFDVGTNHGDWSIEALRAWPQVHVHAFEVLPETFTDLEVRLGAANVRPRIDANACGLADRSGREVMYYFPGHPELTCDRPRHDGLEVRTFEARLMRGDEYAAHHGIPRIDFMKIDVEGAEYRVLQGFSATLAAGLVDCIQFEYGAFSIQTRVLLSDYYAMLGDRYWIGKIYPRYVDFVDYSWTMEGFRFANFLAVSRSRPDLRRLVEG